MAVWEEDQEGVISPKKAKKGRRDASRRGSNITAIMQSKKDGGKGRGW